MKNIGSVCWLLVSICGLQIKEKLRTPYSWLVIRVASKWLVILGGEGTTWLDVKGYTRYAG